MDGGLSAGSRADRPLYQVDFTAPGYTFFFVYFSIYALLAGVFYALRLRKVRELKKEGKRIARKRAAEKNHRDTNITTYLYLELSSDMGIPKNPTVLAAQRSQYGAAKEIPSALSTQEDARIFAQKGHSATGFGVREGEHTNHLDVRFQTF